jgi:hypothetical protein
MGTKPVARFTIEVNGRPRSLFSVVENSTGNLTIGLRTEKYHKERGEHVSPQTKRKRTLNQYYSIHPSLNSAEGINAINHHKYYETGKIEQSHYTRAIKRGDRYALIFVKRSRALNSQVHIPKPNRGKIISIGKYDPKFFTLVYGLVASARGHDFELVAPPEISAAFCDFKRVRLTVLSTFVSMPSTDFSMSGHVVTDAPSDGADRGEIIAAFGREVAILMEELLDTLRFTPEQRQLARKWGLVSKRGYFTPASGAFYTAMVQGRTIIPGYLAPWPLA